MPKESQGRKESQTMRRYGTGSPASPGGGGNGDGDDDSWENKNSKPADDKINKDPEHWKNYKYKSDDKSENKNKKIMKMKFARQTKK